MKPNLQNTRRDFLKKSALSASILGLAIGESPGAGATPAGENPAAAGSIPDPKPMPPETQKAGFAEKDITPEIGMEQPGGYGKVFHKTLHDPCKVRAAVFRDGNRKIAIVGIDALVVHTPVVDAARKQIQARCGIEPDAILIGASHSHSSGPTGMIQPGEFDKADKLVRELAYEKSSCADAGYLKTVEARIVEAVAEADDKAVDAQVGVGRGMEDKVAFNRRFYMNNGLSFTHPGQLNPDIVKVAGPTDPEVGVIGVWDKEGKCIGCIVNYTCHTTTNPGGISANWVYYMEQTIRGAMGPQCVVVFLQGAAGDVTQVNNLNPYVQRKAEDWARFVGGRVGAEAVKVLLDMPRGTLLPLDYRMKRTSEKRRAPSPAKVKESLELVKQSPEQAGATRWTFAKETVLLDAKIKMEPTAVVEVQVLQLGPVVFVTNPSEFFCQLGLDIKAGSPFDYTFVVMLANGCVGYVPTDVAFEKNGGGYETRLTLYSNLEVGAGTKMVKTGLDLVRQLKPVKGPEYTRAPEFTGKPWEYGSLAPEWN